MGYSAKVTLIGAYGLGFGSVNYDCSGNYPVNKDGRSQPPLAWNPGNTFLMIAALIGSAFIVSYPFWRLQERRRAGVDRSYWFRDEPVVLR